MPWLVWNLRTSCSDMMLTTWCVHRIYQSVRTDCMLLQSYEDCHCNFAAAAATEPEMCWLQGASRTLVGLLLQLQPPVRFSRDQASASGRDDTAPTSEQASSSSVARSNADSMACKVLWKGDKPRNRNVCKLDLSATLMLILDVTVEPEDWQYLGRQLFAMATNTYVMELRRLLSRNVISFLKLKDRDAASDPESTQDPPVVRPYIKMLGESQAPLQQMAHQSELYCKNQFLDVVDGFIRRSMHAAGSCLVSCRLAHS